MQPDVGRKRWNAAPIFSVRLTTNLAMAVLLCFALDGAHATTAVILRDNFDTNSLLNKDIYEIWDTLPRGYPDTPLTVEYENGGHVSIGCDANSTRYSLLSCTLPQFPPTAEIYRIEIHMLPSQWPGAGHFYFGYALHGPGLLLRTPNALSGYIVDLASGAGGQRMEYHRLDSGNVTPLIVSHTTIPPAIFSPFAIRRFLIEIDRSGTHRITGTFDTGAALYDRTFEYTDSSTPFILSHQPTKLQMIGAFTANSVAKEGKINTDTWLVEAIDLASKPSSPERRVRPNR